MRKIKLMLVGFSILIPTLSNSQVEIKLESDISNVTIYRRGAQIEREANLFTQQGPMLIKLVGLSPHIRHESIRVDGDGSFTIVNVLHQNDFLNELQKSKENEMLASKIEELNNKIEDEETWLKILTEKLDFLSANKQITGGDMSVDPDNFSALNTIYGNNIETLHLDRINRQRNLKNYREKIEKLKNQQLSLNHESDGPSGTIIVAIEATQDRSSTIRFSYLVDNAGWFPSYDIRFIEPDKPLNITYKANIRQNTGIDWKGVRLNLSTAQTNISAIIPELTPFYLQFYYPEILNALQGRAAGVSITNSSGLPGSDAAFMIRGISSINNSYDPVYIVDGVPQQDISSLDPNSIADIKVIKDASATAIYGNRGNSGVVQISTKSNNEKSPIPLTITTKRETSSEYLVDAPQNISSNDQTSVVSFRNQEIAADFEYQSVPKLSEKVYLIGRISDWYKAELIDGDVNIYLEDSYIGKSRISTGQFSDTLEVSFGIENGISVKRERLQEFSEDKFIGSNRKETLAYRITVRNNKAYGITTKITDQVPVSTDREIQVDILELSGGEPDPIFGKIEWNMALEANESKELIIKYAVKYPKTKRVIVD